MLIIVLVFNCLLAVVCFYAAWRVWQVRRALAGAANVLTEAERATHNVLYGAPEAIQKGQMGAYELRQRYQQLVPQIQKAQQALALLSLFQGFWWRKRRPNDGRSLRKRPSKQRFSP